MQIHAKGESVWRKPTAIQEQNTDASVPQIGETDVMFESFPGSH